MCKTIELKEQRHLETKENCKTSSRRWVKMKAWIMASLSVGDARTYLASNWSQQGASYNMLGIPRMLFTFLFLFVHSFSIINTSASHQEAPGATFSRIRCYLHSHSFNHLVLMQLWTVLITLDAGFFFLFLIFVLIFLFLERKDLVGLKIM